MSFVNVKANNSSRSKQRKSSLKLKPGTDDVGFVQMTESFLKKSISGQSSASRKKIPKVGPLKDLTEESSEIVANDYRPLRAHNSKSPSHLNADDRALFSHEYATSKVSLENYTKKSNTDFNLSESSVKARSRFASKNANILRQNQASPTTAAAIISKGILKSNDTSS